MPEIKLQHVVSCSSEDKNYPSENLLKGDSFKKWKSGGVGEKKISVTLQFEKSTKIHQIDIGNEGSAFVEVLVGKSSSKEDDFQVLLVASSFMNPLDSRACKNTTTVRMFGADKMSKAVCGEKWDRVQVVCTQPFNKTLPYGLSFIKFHSPPEDGSTVQPKQTALGAFKLKSTDSEIKTGSLFSNRDKEKTSPAPLTGAAAVRAASKLAEETQKTASEEKPMPSSSKRKHSDDNFPSVSTSKKTPSKDPAKTPLRKQTTSITSTASSSSAPRDRSKDKQPPVKKSRSDPLKSSTKDVAFNRVMEKVVFVMSGFQNPLRAQLRDKAKDMGAEYSPDWGKHCTHLICAFENTPKYSQVQGKGRIVKEGWIQDCYKAKGLLPWRRYRLGRAKSPPGGSSCSDSEDETPKKETPKNAPNKSKLMASKSKAEDVDVDGEDSGDDTEDEIRRIKEADKRKASPKNQTPSEAVNDDIYDASTDEEMESETRNGVNGVMDSDSNLPELPDYFTSKNFLLYGSFNQTMQRRLKRYIIAYNGRLEQYMTNKVTYVITESEWDDNFDQALSDNPSLAFIKPDWIYACDEKQKLLPFQKYVVVPK